MPVLARVYHLPPREQARLTLQQFRDLQRDYQQLQAAEEG
jgi:hypothetical protein